MPGEISVGGEILQDCQTEIERELKKIGEELLKAMRTNSELRQRLSVSEQYRKAGRKSSPYGARWLGGETVVSDFMAPSLRGVSTWDMEA